MRTARSAGGERAGPGGSRHATLVLASKLRLPAGRPGAVVRQPLLSRLSEDRPARLVVISAPAGWGKTCLLRDWRLADTASRTAWVSVDPGDNDPVRFWAHVIASVAGVSPGFGAAALPVLTAPGAGSTDAILPMLVNELEVLPAPVTLVFDDYHLISNQDILRSVAFMVEHLPPAVRLALAVRADPELPLARLRARGEMFEIRADDLRFTEAETAALLNGTLGLALGQADIRALQQRTEGWAAGLYLAGLSLRGRPEPSAFIQAFAGDDRQIVDYLLAEVLDGLPAEIRAFLLRTSVLDRLSGPLCDAVTGGSGSQRILEEMERANLFLVRLDTRRRWYRYHQLFGELLRHELDRAEPGLAAAASPPRLRVASRSRQYRRGHRACPLGRRRGRRPGADRIWVARLLQRGPGRDRGVVAGPAAARDRRPRRPAVPDTGLAGSQPGPARRGGAMGRGRGGRRARARCGKGWPRSSRLPACCGRPPPDDRGPRRGRAAQPRAVALEESGAARWRAGSLATLGANLCWQGRDGEAVAVLGQVARAGRPLANYLAGVWAIGCLSAHPRPGW